MTIDSKLAYPQFGEQLRTLRLIGVSLPRSHGKKESSSKQPSSTAWPNLLRLIAHSGVITQDIVDESVRKHEMFMAILSGYLY